MEFFPEVSIDGVAAEAMARGLFAVARLDGIHAREAALIASFWSDAGGGASSLAELERSGDITGEELAAALPEPTRVLFVKTAFLLAYADGRASDAEKARIADYAEALGVGAGAVTAMEAQVKEYLLGHLSHLANTEAASQVARKLGV